MDNNLIIIYLSIFVGLLLFAAISVFRQVLKTRKTENSLERLKNKLTKEKGSAQEYYELASIYSEKKVFSQAITLYQKAIKAAEEEEEKDIAPVYNALGYVYFCQDQYDLAIRQYKEAIKLKPDYVTALNNLAHAYEKKKLPLQALQAYQEAVKFNPNNPIAKRRIQSLQRLVSN
ncbi:tetratricopeptide repeat protein [Cylindrospermopsis curvispora]|uniref:Tetratricopeptide repeat protein n=1 Tax=Cylindrospermopsis curvispora GIHE-G1 TaxID=2666332 RepID=A0A7H0F1V3_9CYAN|nr:tetratricopeptide repeat protein [Cylindrospermopsis curvispora]QNP30019.1 tetratricopeptide repeat protein [Cylindrospermopsis curvispora GIHE-G1]